MSSQGLLQVSLSLLARLHHLPTLYHHWRKSGILQLQDAPDCKQGHHKAGNTELPEHSKEAMPAGRRGYQHPSLWGTFSFKSPHLSRVNGLFFFIFPQEKSYKHSNQKTIIFRFSFLDGDPTLHPITLKRLLFPY